MALDGVLLKGGCVLSLDKRIGNLREADVLVDDGRVAEIGPGLRSRDAEVIDARDTIVMPGFVDAHRHASATLLRNLGTAEPESQTSDPTGGRHPSPDDIYAATLLALASSIEAGITTVVDCADLPPSEAHTEAALQAHADAQLRTVFVHPLSGSHGTAALDATGLIDAGADRGCVAGPRTTTALGTLAPSLGDSEALDQAFAQARELGLRIHMHAGSDPACRGVVAKLADRGFISGDITIVHGTALDADDLDAIATHGAPLALAPASAMTNGLGPPPLQELIDRGIRPGLAIGDERLAPGDLFAQMRAVQSLQRATAFELKLAGKSGVPHLLGTREVIRHATVDGARAAGLGDTIGTLAPGMQADIVVLRTDRPNIFPVNDPIGAVVWGMDASNVDHVFVGGRALLRDGVLVADGDQVRLLADAAWRRLTTTPGSLVESGDGGPR